MRYTSSKFMVVMMLTVFCGALSAQINPTTQIAWTMATGTTAPTATCPGTPPSGALVGQPYTNSTTGAFYVCSGSGWSTLSTSGALPLSGGTLTGPLGGTSASFSGALTAYQLGAVFQCDKFSGADVSVKADACNAAAIAAGGGTIDLRTLMDGATSGGTEIEIGPGVGETPNIGVTALLPTDFTYTATMVGAPVTKAAVYRTSSGTGYVTGDLVTPVQTGYGFSGTATGAVFSVTASGGAVSALTLVSGGTGYLTSKYNTTTTNNAGTGLIINTYAADCGMRLNNEGTLQTGSVGAGATTAVIVPSGSDPGFSMQAGFCAGGGYVRQEGGLKVANFTGKSVFTYGTDYTTGLVDQSSFFDLESSTLYDDGIDAENFCCGTHFDTLHADNGGSAAAGVPISFGQGTTIFNVCTTSGSNLVTLPYGHMTIKYLGDYLQSGATGVTLPFASAPTITSVASATSFYTNINANATTSGQSQCTSPTVGATGSGITLNVMDPTLSVASNEGTVLHEVANGPGVGLPDIMVNRAVAVLSFLGGYNEPQDTNDHYTPTIYMAEGTTANFFGISTNTTFPTKPALTSDSVYAGAVQIYGSSMDFVLDQGVKHTLPNGTYANGGLPYGWNGGNWLGNTTFSDGSTYWTPAAGVSFSSLTGLEGSNSIAYTAPTTTAGILYTSQIQSFTVPVGMTVTFGGNLNLTGCAEAAATCATPITGGYAEYELRTSPTGGSFLAGAPTVSAGAEGFVSGTYVGTGATVYFVVLTNAVVSTSGSGVAYFSHPFLTGTQIPIYTANDGPPQTVASSGHEFLSISLPSIGSSTNALCTTTGGLVTNSCGKVANVAITVGTTTINAGTCGTMASVAMTNLTTGMTVAFTPVTDVHALVGWGPAAGALTFVPVLTAGTLDYYVCNYTATNITPGSSTTWNVSAK